MIESKEWLKLINEILPNSTCISKYDVLSGNILLQSANKKIKKEFKIENDEQFIEFLKNCEIQSNKNS